MKRFSTSFIGLVLCCLGSVAFASESPVITIKALKAAPTIDGSGEDWQDIPSTEIPLTYLGDKTPTKTVQLKAGVFGDRIYFYSEWDDDTEDTLHKPYVWDDNAGKYVSGPQREDRFALQFAMKGDYTTDWFSGKEFTADMWHWKAGRTNPSGFTHDKSTVISKKAMRESYKQELPNGESIYIYRPSDGGAEPYKANRYFKKQNDVMPKYTPVALDTLHKSASDISAKGVWKDGKWHLEQSRKLATGYADDVTFVSGENIKGGIAIFDHDVNEHHFASETLTFSLQF